MLFLWQAEVFFQKPWLMTRDLLLGLRMTEGPKGFGFGF
jgi:hypothetical protein